MTELERARAHLRDEQEVLAARRYLMVHAPFPEEWEPSVRKAEEGVLAALSWVWEAQEAERLATLDRMLTMTGMRRFSGVIPAKARTFLMTMEPGAETGLVRYAGA